MQQWYYDTTSEWTLDYPPLFAYFEWALSQIAVLVDPAAVQLSATPIKTVGVMYFQRISVICSEAAIWLAWGRHYGVNSEVGWRNLALVVFCPALIVVDCELYADIHFQYNGLLLGLLCLSLSLMSSGHFKTSCFLFVLLVGFKHIFLYMAPGYLSYLLVRHILPKGHLHVLPVVQLSLIGLGTLAAILWPFRGDY